MRQDCGNAAIEAAIGVGHPVMQTIPTRLANRAHVWLFAVEGVEPHSDHAK